MSTGLWLGDPWGLLGAVLALALVALVVVAILALLRPAAEAGGAARPSAAIRLLEERYARGEISREEFLERRQVLSAPPPADGP